MNLFLLFVAAFISGTAGAYSAPLVRHIQVEGNVRIPEQSILQQISTISDEPLAPINISEDLKKLYRCGFFEDVQVLSRNAGPNQVDIIYSVREHPFISSFLIEGVDEGLGDRIRSLLREKKLELRPGTPFNPSAGNKAALAVRDFFRSRKYPNARVLLSTHPQGSGLRVALDVEPGQRMEVGSVRFIGNDFVPDAELIHQMQYSRPSPFWARWGGAAHYIPEELDSDLQRISLYYRSHGFAAVSVGRPRIRTIPLKEKPKLEIEIPISEGVRYRLLYLGSEGTAKAASADVRKLVGAVKTPCDYDYTLLESTRQKIADALGRHGYALARVQLKQSLNASNRTVQAVFLLDSGDPVVVGNIEFCGNRHLPDKFLRRELKIGEGEVFDTAKLDQSVERLNKSDMLMELHRADVALEMNPKTSLLDITFKVKEKDRQGLYFTGGSGGINGGYLGLLYTAFNLLRLGETLSLELDGGAAQSNMILNIVGTRFLGSPFSLALSTFNRAAGYNIASIVPDAGDIVQIFHRRTVGAGLSGAYPVTEDLQAGLSFSVKRDSIEGTQTDHIRDHSLTSELSPFVAYDKTCRSGTIPCRYKLTYTQSWDGPLFLSPPESMRESAGATLHLQDPWTHGRNSLAFHLQGARVRPVGNHLLTLDRRLFPGDEIVRGFGRGALSSWASAKSDSGPTLEAVGADTVMEFSAEYRIPIRGSLSSVGFFDIGWSHLKSRNAVQAGSEAQLLSQANGVLRSSLGGELRLQLPIIREPGRLIFSLNPLRLNVLIRDSSSLLRLVEPRTTLRFALGATY
jgi:outer membrane protein assembly complex protein YaeT